MRETLLHIFLKIELFMLFNQLLIKNFTFYKIKRVDMYIYYRKCNNYYSVKRIIIIFVDYSLSLKKFYSDFRKVCGKSI